MSGFPRLRRPIGVDLTPTLAPFTARFSPAHGLGSGPMPVLVSVGPFQELAQAAADENLAIGSVELWYAMAGPVTFLDRAAQVELAEHQSYLRRADAVDAPLVAPRDRVDGGATCLRVVLTGCQAMADEIVERFGSVLTLPPTGSALQHLLAYRRVDGCDVEIGLSEGGRTACSLFGALAEQATAGTTTSRRSRIVRLAMRCIRTRVHQAIGVSDLAAELGVSPEHLARLFAKEMGESPGRVIAREKMRRARELLKDSRLAIGTVAEQLGYASASHFTRCFRAEYQLSPSEYRVVASVSIP